ncbi:PHD finger protein 20 isoform X2 [Neocloeon triangulifer]|uniref:PHD finger protein 20 isoform X2 n=1 Tax=Neocloeon triangulifer TaxID=2078957 RepID=UPI00286ED887|nr:PHD finger protein 20 isoform X2 [Neocloeon triangulifer]
MADEEKASESVEDIKNNKIKRNREKSLSGSSKEKRQKTSPNGNPELETEAEFTLENYKEADKNFEIQKNNNSNKLELEFNKGLRIEVKDLPSDIWYVAKVVDIEGADVLIHYVNWAARHDEWIPMDSNRIRPLGENAPPAPPVVTPVPSRKRGRPAGSGVKNKTPSVAAEPPEIENKEDCVSFIVGECVKAVWTDSRKYPATVVDVLENDMYKVVFSDGLEKIVSWSKISKSKTSDLLPSPPTLVALPAALEPQVEDLESKESRRQRKRKINVAELFRRKSSTSKPMTSESSTPVPAKRLKTEEPEEQKLPSPTTTNLPVVHKRGRGRPPRKSMDASVPSEGKEELEMEFECPTAETPESKSFKEIVNKDIPSHQLLQPKKVVSPEVILPEVPLEVPEEQNDIIIGTLKVEKDGDNLKCPKEGCGKLLRKEKLIMMHIKHYHPELKEQMDVVPQVLDYAYARYIGDLPSTASMIRNFSNPHTSSASSNSSNAPKKRPVKSPVKAPIPEVVKVEELPMTPPLSSQTPRIQLGKPSSKSASKSGLKVKTLLPVRKSLPPKAPEVKEKLEKTEPKKCFEMPVLKKALMTPPMNFSTPLKNVNNCKEFATKEEKPLAITKPPAPPIPKKSPRKSPRKDQLVDDGAMELINCVCGYTEEDGLIIQCDLCFCWQHGLCNFIDREEDVPDKFICHVCRNPPRERKSRKYSHDQDWLKKGSLPRLPVLRLNEKLERSSLEKALKETQDLAAAALSLNEIMHALKIQINISQKKDHPKLYLWSKEWKELVNGEPCRSGDLKGSQLATTAASQNTFVPLEVVKLEPDLVEGDVQFEPIPGTSGSQGNVDDADLHPALKLPLSALEIEHLATNLAESIPTAETTLDNTSVLVLNPPAAPEPEAAIKPEKCRVLLLKHIHFLQDQLEESINELEERNLTLERRAPQIYGKEVSDARVKETLRMLRRDIGSVHKIGNYAMKDTP